jgi:hypothetical protein
LIRGRFAAAQTKVGGKDIMEVLSSDSVNHAMITSEPSLANAKANQKFAV